jgi:hypothetical protein
VKALRNHQALSLILSQADVDDEATQSLVDGFVGGINFGELVTDDTVDMATEATDEEEQQRRILIIERVYWK